MLKPCFRDEYDSDHDTFYPVLSEDLKVETLTDLLSTEAEVYMETIFLEACQEECRQFESVVYFKGIVKKDEETREISDWVYPAHHYRAVVEHRKKTLTALQCRMGKQTRICDKIKQGVS